MGRRQRTRPIFADIDPHKKQTLIFLDYYKGVRIIYIYIYGCLGMLKVFLFCMKTGEKSLREEKKNPIFAHSSIVKANLHGLVRKKKHLRRFQQQIYKEKQM